MHHHDMSKNGTRTALPALQEIHDHHQPCMVGVMIVPEMMTSEVRRDSLESDDDCSHRKPFMTYGLFLLFVYCCFRLVL